MVVIPLLSDVVVPILVGTSAVLPSAAHESDAGVDLRSAAEVRLEPGNWALVPTGIRLNLPAGHVGLIVPRSGLALREGVTVLNAPGCVDPGYTGQIGVMLINLGLAPYVVLEGDRVAQLLLVPFMRPRWSEVTDLDDSDRGGSGFGSSGR
ncbi:dUTP diphosphatase [Micromonospora sp. ATA32]|nr:dUTP diphosphatase [Micromonospora sp. ATA32]